MSQYTDFAASLERMLKQRTAVMLLQKPEQGDDSPNALLSMKPDGSIEVQFGDGQDMRITVTVYTVDDALDRLTRALPGWEWESMR